MTALSSAANPICVKT